MKYLPFHEALEDCSRLAGKVPQASYLDEGDFPVIGQGKQPVEGFTNDSGLVFRGDLPVILFGDHTAAFKFIDRPFARGADGTKLFRPRTQYLDAKFAWHFLQTAKLPETGYDRKTKYLESLRIPLPPLEEQRRIAAILDKASAIKSCSEKAARNAADIKASLFDEAFIAHDRHGHWEQLALGELCDVQGGLQVTSARSAMPIRVPYLRVANVLRGRLDLAEIKEINCSQPELDRTRLQPKDLLVVEGHGNPNEIGRVAMWTEQPGEMVHQNHLIRVRSKASSLDPEFLCFYLNSRMGRRHLLKRANTTSGLNTISTSVVKSAPIILPPVDEQRSFCETIKNIAQLEASLLVSSALHAQLSRSLLSESFDK
jgi:type I restriction enzyme S subunit